MAWFARKKVTIDSLPDDLSGRLLALAKIGRTYLFHHHGGWSASAEVEHEGVKIEAKSGFNFKTADAAVAALCRNLNKLGVLK